MTGLLTSKPDCSDDINLRIKDTITLDLLYWGERLIECKKRYQYAKEKGECLDMYRCPDTFEITTKDGQKRQYSCNIEIREIIKLAKTYGLLEEICYDLICKCSNLLSIVFLEK